MAKLTMAERKALPKSDFAVPSKAPYAGSYPIPNQAHANVAAGLAGMHGGPVAAVPVHGELVHAAEAIGGHVGTVVLLPHDVLRQLPVPELGRAVQEHPQRAKAPQ